MRIPVHIIQDKRRKEEERRRREEEAYRLPLIQPSKSDRDKKGPKKREERHKIVVIEL